MNKSDADKKAKELLGETAFAVRISHKDRNQRFGIMLIDNGAAWSAGFGSSFDVALMMAVDEVNQAKKAVEAAKEVQPEVKE